MNVLLLCMAMTFADQFYALVICHAMMIKPIEQELGLPCEA
jgi:hypothetical protein